MIHILMATYNGEKYVEKQVQSILSQTNKNWMLHICDDCSEDNTREIIQKYVKLYPEQISYMENTTNQGARNTFSRLIREIREPGDYVFCDQDDIWKPDKLKTMEQTLRINEVESDMPVLVYSDVEIIDEYGNQTAESFVRKSGLHLPKEHLLEHLFLYNFVQGASMMWNYPLHQLVTEIPSHALMHDWWLALVAAGQGKIVFIDKTLAAYRQHSRNEIGAFDRKQWRKSMVNKIRFSNWNKIFQNNQRLQRERLLQAKVYNQHFKERHAEFFIKNLEDKNHLRRAFRGIRGGYIFISKKYSLKFYIL